MGPLQHNLILYELFLAAGYTVGKYIVGKSNRKYNIVRINLSSILNTMWCLDIRISCSNVYRASLLINLPTGLLHGYNTRVTGINKFE